ncbi:MAG TPA: DHA2 family efflux MFS transporter permease subunit [Chthoniobacterales bacterium]|nr:DHA2 family efflux MFS transporter permease subunit [Chthoniobacterales bacterium]
MSADAAAPLPNEWKPSFNPWLIAISIMLATIIEVLDTSVANVSLPYIAGNLSASTDEATWVLTSYLLSNAIILPATNWLGQVFGRKRFLISCIILFTLASALCGLAGSLGFLIMARVLQGAAGGALQPISQAVLMESFPPAKRGVAMAVFTMGIVVAPILGPVIGGWLTYNYSWRWAFYINLPVGILATVLCRAFLEDPPYLKRSSAADIDYIGFGLLAIWLASLQIMLDKGQELDWFGSRMIVWCAVIAIAGFIAFLVRELVTAHPIVDLRILKNRNFAIGNVLMLLIGALLYATIAILPLFMQNLLHYTALAAGMAMTPFGIGAFTATIIVGRISGHISNRVLIIISCLLFGCSSFALGNINLQVAPANLLWPIIIAGVGASSMYVPVATAAMGTLSQEQMGNAAGIFNLMRNIGGSIGIASITTLVTRHAQASQANLAWHMSKFNFAFQQQLAHLQTALASHTGNWAATKKSLAVLYGTLQEQSSLLSYVYGFRFCVLVCVLCAALALLFKKANKPAGPIAAH